MALLKSKINVKTEFQEQTHLSFYSVISAFICFKCRGCALIGVFVGGEHRGKTYSPRKGTPLSAWRWSPSTRGEPHGYSGERSKITTCCTCLEYWGGNSVSVQHLSWALKGFRRKKKVPRSQFPSRCLRFEVFAPFMGPCWFSHKGISDGTLSTRWSM